MLCSARDEDVFEASARLARQPLGGIGVQQEHFRNNADDTWLDVAVQFALTDALVFDSRADPRERVATWQQEERTRLRRR